MGIIRTIVAQTNMLLLLVSYLTLQLSVVLKINCSEIAH